MPMIVLATVAFLSAMGFLGSLLWALDRHIRLAVANREMLQFAVREREILAQKSLLESNYHLLDKEFTEYRARQSERLLSLEKQLKFLQEAKIQLEQAFKAIAGEVSARALTQLQSQNRHEIGKDKELIANLLKPVRECVEKLERRVNDSDQQRSQMSGKFEEQLKQLLQASQGLGLETRKLNSALRRPQVRGRWGEMQLRRLVELAGMQSHVDFNEQVAVSTDGRTLIADMVVNLPDHRKVVVDSKVSMDAYLNALESNEETLQEQFLKQHADQVSERIQELGKKNYWKYFDATFDFVILFLPADHLYAAAVEKRPQLMEEALQRHVLLATPMMLMALLKTIGCSWTQFAAGKEAEHIVKLANSLLERAGVLFGKLAKTGQYLHQTVRAYNETVGSIESRLRPTLSQLSQLQSLGNYPLEELPEIDSGLRSLRDVSEPDVSA